MFETQEHFWVNKYPCTKWIEPVKPPRRNATQAELQNYEDELDENAAVADIDAGNQGDIFRLDLLLKAPTAYPPA